MIEQYSNELMNISRQSTEDIPANTQPQDIPQNPNLPQTPPQMPMPRPNIPPQTGQQPQDIPRNPNLPQTPPQMPMPRTNIPPQTGQQPQDIPRNPNMTQTPPQMPMPNNMDQFRDNSANMTYEQFLAENPGIGALRIQVFSGQQSVPIPNAEVIVSKNFADGQKIFFDGLTNISGIVDNIELPAPSREISESPQPRGDGVEMVLPYSQYNVMVKEQRYRQQEYTHVPIFDGIKSIQPVRMTPVQFSNGNNDTIVFPEMEPNNL